jgi:Zinc finger, C2H2 type
MVYCSSTNMSSQNESEVESLLMSPCWNAGTNGQDYLLDGHKLLLDHDLESLPSDSENQKSSLDMLDNLLSNSNNISSNTNLAELKPLPPFTGYTGHLSINGISGHHYHAIAQRMPEENNNNNYTHSSYQTQCGTNNNNNSSTDHNIVSSSTCLPDSVLNPDGSDSCLSDVKLFSDNSIDGKIYSITSADSCVITSGPDSVSNGNNHHNNNNNLNGTRIYVDAKELAEYDMSSIEDIAAIIGSAIADTTVPNNQSDNGDTGGDTRDSWMDLDAWIEETVVPQDSKLIVSHNDSLNDFILPHSPMHSGSTLQSLLTHGYMPLLQNRLQNGPPIKIEAPTSTSYCNDLISTSTSPPGSVCSTTDNVMLNGNRYMSSNNNNNNITINNNVQAYQIINGLKNDGLCSPELMGNYPHTTSSSSTKIKRPRNPKKSQSHLSVSSGANGHQQQMQQQVQNQTNVSVSAHGFQSPNDLSGLLGKEKPVHRCTICNRGFLNKSNIKVHLRTHTGEKPFRCEICAKAFRQKAHLIKHQQIHKRIGRD